MYVLLVALLLSAMIGIHTSLLDGLHGRLLSLALATDTEYAKGYSDDAFRRVRLGQGKEEVLGLIGEPLFKRSDATGRKERWIYSRSQTSSHYFYREVQLAGDVVSEKRHHFYID